MTNNFDQAAIRAACKMPIPPFALSWDRELYTPGEGTSVKLVLNPSREIDKHPHSGNEVSK